MEEIVLEAKQISKSYPGTLALDKADFRARMGKVNVLIGENGAGKSTMMKIIAGVETKTSGDIFINGKAANYQTPVEAIGHGVGIIYQELNLFPNLSIAENMFMTREIKKNRFSVDHKKQNDKAAFYLKKLKLEISPETPVGSLRIGQQQLVEIAKVLSQDAEIIIMDEPTSALTEVEVSTLFAVIEELKKHGVTVIYISHRLEEIMHIGDYVTILRDGHSIDEKKIDEVDISWIIGKMTGGYKIDKRYVRRDMDREILAVKNLSLKKKNGTGYAVEDLSFSLKAGEILGFYGLLGSGRTELLECLIGAQTEYSGTVALEGTILKSKNVNERIKNGFALIPEDRKNLGIFSNMVIVENMVISSLSRFFKRLFLNQKMAARAARGVVNDLSIKMPALSYSINFLSGGNQQKVIIGRSLLTNPKVLLMDDPTRGVDIAAKYDVYDICKKLASEGMGIVFVSSEIQEMLSIPDRVLVLSKGRLKGEFVHEDVTEEKLISASAISITRKEE
jgi:erythritol transport system ATP-binding protein